MTDAGARSRRRAALGAALDALPAPAPELPVGVLPVTGVQWRRSVADADLDARVAEYGVRRLSVTSSVGPALRRHLRFAALGLAAVARDVCERLEILAALAPGAKTVPDTVHAWRELIVQDAHAVLIAAIENAQPPRPPMSPALPDVAVDDDRDVLLATFGIPADDLLDDAGSFCDTRLLAFYRLRLPELQQACDPILALIGDCPPSVFTAAAAARDLVTSPAPWVTLWAARDIRARILGAFDADPRRTVAVLADAAQESDQEWSAFLRVTDRVRRAEAVQGDPAGTERDYAISVLEAYKHMAEGLTRRWAWVLLRLADFTGHPPTVGTLGPPLVSRLGELGARIEAALVPVVRNAEAHEDFIFDEETGLLVTGDASFHPDEILARLTDLDILQRALIVGRLAAFADEPALAGGGAGAPGGPSASSAIIVARQRFGHAGQRVRYFVRDRDRLDIVIQDLRSEACNPCFLALTQAAQVLPTVSQFVVRVPGRDGPVIDLTQGVLRENWRVLELAAEYFPDALPQVTFLPCLTWTRLVCEPLEEATRVAAWMALNDAQHAIVDAEATPAELLRLPRRFGVVIAATASTIRVLPEGPHIDELLRAQRVVLRAANAFARGGPDDVTTNILLDAILRVRDRLGGPPAVLPTLDPTPLREGSYPHGVS